MTEKNISHLTEISINLCHFGRQDGGVGLPQLGSSACSTANPKLILLFGCLLQILAANIITSIAFHMPYKTWRKATTEKQQQMEPVTVAFLEETLTKFFNDAERKSDKKFDHLQNQLTTIQHTLLKHAEDIEKQRSRIDAIESRVQTNDETLPKLREALTQMEQKLVALEDRNRRNNHRIMNIKEGEERGNMLTYLSNNIPKWFPGLTCNPPELIRAHRLGPPRQSATPRITIVKCLHFTDRDRILNESRKTPVHVSGQQIRMAPDYSDATAKKRCPCYPVMNRARALGFQAFLLYPAVIKFSNGAVQHLFSRCRKVPLRSRVFQ